MKITRSPMARLMVAMATILLVFPIPANACNWFGRRVVVRRCQPVRVFRCQPVRVFRNCAPVIVSQPVNSGTVIVDPTITPSVIVDPNAGSVQIPSVITPTGQVPQVDETAPNSGPPAPVTGFSLDGVKSSRVEITPPVPINDVNFNIINLQRQVLLIETNTPLNFQLSTPNQTRPTRFSLIHLDRGPAVKAAQEETPESRGPVISLLNLGNSQVKADQEETNTPPQPAADDGPPQPEPPPVAADAFVLADNRPMEANADDPYPTPVTEIGGAEKEYKIGDLIELWVKPLAKKPEDLKSVNYTWTILPVVPMKVWPDSTRVLFGTGPQNTTYIVILNASYVFAEEDPEGKIDNIVQRTAVSMATVKVGGGGTTPPTDPTDPGPSLTGLARLSYDWTAQVNRTNTYTDANVKTDAAKLAASFRTVAAKIQDGTLRDVSSILRTTKDSNDAAIEARDQWLPWFTKMSEHLQKSYNDGTIKTTTQFNQAWLDIAKGLEAAAR